MYIQNNMELDFVKQLKFSKLMTTLKQAIQWFNSLPSLRKTQLCDTNTDIVGSVRRWETLTGSEIKEIFLKENKTTENIYLNRLKEQYKKVKGFEKSSTKAPNVFKKHYNDYQAMRLFCLDTQLVSFNDIEVMESEINQSF